MNNICGIASLINNYKSGTAPLWLHQSIITKAALLLDSTINLNCCMNNICGIASLINNYKSGTAPLWLHQSIITKAALLLDSTINLNCCMNNICGFASLINNYKSGTAPLWLHQSIITKAALLLYDGDLKLDSVAFVFVTSFFAFLMISVNKLCAGTSPFVPWASICFQIFLNITILFFQQSE